jgi:dihydrofolate synthase/folylpolyglutamate synthase
MEKSRKILRRLELLHPKKIDLSLDRLRILLNKLNNPHLRLPPVIHVAGTNGKGSVTSILRSIYETSKLNVQCYTSPHIIKFNERIRINSKLITNDYLNILLEECEFYNKGEEITFFEITTAAAFLAFSRVNSDLLILETGLGGRFDATNIIEEKICSVITPISMDHMNFLGSKISLIAREKLGIVKNSDRVIISKQKSYVKYLIRTYLKKINTVSHEEGKDWKVLKKDYKKRSFLMNFREKDYEFNFPSLYGDHQIENASTAISTVLSITNFNISNESINTGLLKTNWPARMQKLKGKLSKKAGRGFDIWLDGGHNLDASEMLSKIVNSWEEKKIILIIGMINGKDPINFLNKLIHNISLLIILPINDHQCVMPYEIKNLVIKKFNPDFDIECCLNIEEAIVVTEKKFSGGKILVCGSLYLSGEILRADGYKIA